MEVTHSARNYAALDGMRGYAAVLVSLTHFVGFYALGFRGLNVERATYVSVPHAVDALFLWLYLNMQSLYILLTISGFMVCRMVMRSSYRGYGHFLLARSVRIYPPLLFSLGFAVALASLLSEPVDLSLRNILYNVFALNGIFELKGQQWNFPSWSLFYEIGYCLFVPAFVALARRTTLPAMTLLALWSPVLLALALAGFTGWILFAPFVFGSLLAQLDDRRLIATAKRIPTWTVIAAYAVVSALPSSWAPIPRIDETGVHFAPSYIVFILLACMMACLLLVKTDYSEGVLQRVFSIPLLAFLGKVSYSFYLLHAPLIPVAFVVLAPLVGRWSDPGGVAHLIQLLAIFWVMVGASAILGFHAVEMIYFRSPLSSRSKARASIAAADSVPA